MRLTEADYTTIHYPAGETQVRLTQSGVEKIKSSREIQILSRIQSAQDVVNTSLLINSIYGLNSEIDIELILPYLPYSRADRRFCEGDCLGLGAFLGMLGYFDITTEGDLSIKTLDRHSNSVYVTKNIEPTLFITQAITDMMRKYGDITLVYPDAGAALRYTKLLPNYKFVHGSKVRDSLTGDLKGFSVPEFEGPGLIIDDICDGGGTFIGVGNEIRRTNNSPLGLYVSHGIFSKGLIQLKEIFENIYCTNSYSTTPLDGVTVYDCETLLLDN